MGGFPYAAGPARFRARILFLWCSLSLSSEEIAAVVEELQALVGGTIQKIWTPSQRSSIWELRVPGATHLLALSAEPNETRLHAATSRPPSPRNPYGFQGLLRAHLLPSRLVALRKLEGERVVRLEFETQGGPRVLVGELTGRHGNLLLLGPDDEILGLAAVSRSSTRPLRRGVRYEPPPPMAAGEGGNRFSAREVQPDALFPLSVAIESTYLPKEVERELGEQRREAARLLAQARKRSESALRKLEAEAGRARRAEDWLHLGELLKTRLGAIPRGATSVLATDYREEGPVEVEIPLRPELSPRQNLERYFQSYRRMTAATVRIDARKEELAARLELLEALQRRFEEARAPGEVAEVLREVRAAATRGGPSRQAPERSPKREGREERRPSHRTFRSGTGRTIWVGRGARDNDRLTFRVAKPTDLWLHARGVSGAHVVVPLERGAVVEEETLLDACALAAHVSGATNEGVAEITLAQVRHLRKRKGAAPGSVTLTQDQTMAYRADPARLERLLATET
jgi:predicted ribosome quality control (RQC) complex YloA/Tae2 family protein